MENIVKTNDGCQIELRQLESNIEYALYVPKDVTPDTPIFTYVYGSGGKNGWYSKSGGGSYGPYDALIENGSDSIVIMPSMRWGEDWGKKTMEMVNSVRAEYGITNTNLSGGGFSYGGSGGFSIVAENLKQNGASNMEPQIVYFIDDYSKKTYEGYRNILNSEEIDLFKENNTVFFAYDNKSSNAIKEYAKAGLNIIKVKSDNGAHMQIKENFFKNNIYDYAAGGQLPSDGYTYQKANVTVDPKTGKKVLTWEEINVNDIDTKEELYNYLGLDSSKSSTNLGITPLTNSSSVSERDVFVDLAAVQQWKTQLDAINEESISQLATILTTIASLEDYWVGNFSKGFIQDSSNFVTNAQKIHNEMKGVFDPILNDVINVESNL